jgi:hypothetical protein
LGEPAHALPDVCVPVLPIWARCAGSRAAHEAIVRPNAGAIAPHIPLQPAASESIAVW